MDLLDFLGVFSWFLSALNLPAVLFISIICPKIQFYVEFLNFSSIIGSESITDDFKWI